MSTSTEKARTVGDTPKGGTVLGFYTAKDSPRPPRIARGDGIYLWDDGRRRYLDATAGAVVANIGHGNPRVLAAMKAQADKVTFAYPRFFESEESIELADRACALAGDGFDRAFFVSGGSEANEAALKLARQYADLDPELRVLSDGVAEERHVLSSAQERRFARISSVTPAPSSAVSN